MNLTLGKTERKPTCQMEATSPPMSVSAPDIPLQCKQNLTSGFLKPPTFLSRALLAVTHREVVTNMTWPSQFPTQFPSQVPEFWNVPEISSFLKKQEGDYRRDAGLLLGWKA